MLHIQANGIIHSTHLLFYILLSLMTATTSFAQSNSHIINTFDPAEDGLPESITVDWQGHFYTSMGPVNSVRKYTSNGKLLKVYDLNLPPANFNTGVITDWQQNIFVNVASFTGDANTAGVWRINRQGDIAKYADLDPTGFPNGLVCDNYGNLYVSDGVLGKIYKIDTHGNVTDWLVDPALANVSFVGVNGIVLSHNQRFLYAANTDKGTLLRIRIKRNGQPGNIKEIANDSALMGTDGITLNRRGSAIFAAVNFQNTIVKVNIRTGKVTTVLENDANLDGPADLVFGARRKLYIANAALFSEEKLPSVVVLKRKKRYQR